MRLRVAGLAGALLLACVAPLHAAPSPFGRWLTQDRDGVVEIRPCGADLCGRVIGLDLPRLPNGDVPRDPQGRPHCGLQILQAEPAAVGAWDGRITDPSDGTSWHFTLRLNDQGQLKLRGYVLTPLLGRTQTWTPYAGTLGADCAMR